jgi:hypothetical protein
MQSDPHNLPSRGGPSQALPSAIQPRSITASHEGIALPERGRHSAAASRGTSCRRTLAQRSSANVVQRERRQRTCARSALCGVDAVGEAQVRYVTPGESHPVCASADGANACDQFEQFVHGIDAPSQSTSIPTPNCFLLCLCIRLRHRRNPRWTGAALRDITTPRICSMTSSP